MPLLIFVSKDIEIIITNLHENDDCQYVHYEKYYLRVFLIIKIYVRKIDFPMIVAIDNNLKTCWISCDSGKPFRNNLKNVILTVHRRRVTFLPYVHWKLFAVCYLTPNFGIRIHFFLNNWLICIKTYLPISLLW